jgi:hypothetical protein
VSRYVIQADLELVILWLSLPSARISGMYHYVQLPINPLQEGSRAPVAHICNPSYSGGRDQEDRGSKPAQGK